jgi:16S rRNA (guanine527-N7)-methyltransferase
MTEASETFVAGLDVSRETFLALEQLEQLVRRWTATVNLVSASSLAEIWQRHIVDSAQLFQFCPKDARSWLDIGSGGGFPALVVAILAREKLPGMRVTLVESDKRKAAFLHQAARSLGLEVTVRGERIENLDPVGADILSARALAALPDLLTYADRHLRKGGLALFPKGARFADEIEAARKAWLFDVETHTSLSDPAAAILEIRKIRRA